jgi:hypothetical protein
MSVYVVTSPTKKIVFEIEANDFSINDGHFVFFDVRDRKVGAYSVRGPGDVSYSVVEKEQFKPGP